MEGELPPVGDGGDPVPVRLTVQRGLDFSGLPARSYLCAVDKDADLAALAGALTAELHRSGVCCSGVVLRADNQTLDGRLTLRDGCTVPSVAKRRRGEKLEIAFGLEGYSAAGGPSRPALSAEGASWGLLPKRYTLGEELGRGAYGQVRKARDADSGAVVAVKRVECSLDHSPEHAKRLLREVMILRQVDSAHLVKLRGVCLAGGETSSSFTQLFLVFDKCDGDLREMISSGPSLEEAGVAELLQDILGGVAYLHNLSILHRDLKPANCLLRGAGPQGARAPPARRRVLLCDLGLSRPVPAASPAAAPPPPLELVRQISGHVVTRWYRAPELLLSSERYGEPVDVWAVGCIFGELLQLAPSGGGSKPLFPGKGSTQSPRGSSVDPAEDMLAVIVRVLGPGSARGGELAEARPYAIADAERASAASPGTPLRELLPSATPGASRLLRGLLAFEPKARPTARQALGHGFLAGLEPASAPEAPPRPLEDLGLEAADEELRDPSRRAGLLRGLRERLREELDAWRA